MLHIIQNKNLICTISSEGAEIRSLKHKTTGKEYIWQINESVWGSSSPVLFPAIGKIKSDKIKYNDKTFKMPKHGIIRHNTDLEFAQHEEDYCSFTLKSSTKISEKYPFQFEFKVSYKLVDNNLIMTYNVENQDKVDIPFICGGHSAYACPLDQYTQLTDYVIEFPKPIDLQALTLGKSGLLSTRIRDIKTENNLLQLSDNLFDEDALIFENIGINWVRLRHRNSDKGVVVKFKGYPNLALWAKPGADYVCIEPWLGLPDREDESIDITKKSTYKHLSPNEKFSIAIETIIE